MLTIHWHATAGLNTFLKYGPTPDEPTPHWYPFLFETHSGTGAKIYADRIQVYYVDGLRGDDDLAANGILVDPGSPAVTVHPWQNPVWPHNVNNDSLVSALDVLMVINEINARGARELPPAPIGDQVLPPFWDATGDDRLGPIDALVVINYINNNLTGEGEATRAPELFLTVENERHSRDQRILQGVLGRLATSPGVASDADVGDPPPKAHPLVDRPSRELERRPWIVRQPSPVRAFDGVPGVDEFLGSVEEDLAGLNQLEEILPDLASDIAAARHLQTSVPGILRQPATLRGAAGNEAFCRQDSPPVNS
jgi:hypothetical protein